MDFDLLVHEAWPAYEQRPHDGWVLRHAGGVTKRANSVLPLGSPADLAGAIAEAETFYARRGLPCVFSIGPGATPGLDGELAARGYQVVDPTVIMAGPVVREPVLDKVRVEERPWLGWLETWWAVDGRYGSGLAEAERICTGVPAWYAAVEEDGVPVAVGRGVPQGDMLGVYCMATLPSARRRGLARSVLRALVRHFDGTSAYLVVTSRNQGARALYGSEGLAVKGEYHYRAR
ncbi:GNAT family N-acetyltransferase [Nonomuraea sp. ZG12]|uniref:GNAT family N-acetyltransferase n=1 Tax=Nonomuraea sp. ZG12 TaxID=3452207 RepID=UPI003F8BC241